MSPHRAGGRRIDHAGRMPSLCKPFAAGSRHALPDPGDGDVRAEAGQLLAQTVSPGPARESRAVLQRMRSARVSAARRSRSGTHCYQQRAPGQHGAGGRHHCAFCSAPRQGVHDDSQREVAEEHPCDDTERPLPPVARAMSAAAMTAYSTTETALPIRNL